MIKDLLLFLFFPLRDVECEGGRSSHPVPFGLSNIYIPNTVTDKGKEVVNQEFTKYWRGCLVGRPQKSGETSSIGFKYYHVLSFGLVEAQSPLNSAIQLHSSHENTRSNTKVNKCLLPGLK